MPYVQIQYRMNLEINDFVSRRFYQGTVQSAEDCKNRVLQHHFPHYNPQHPIILLNVVSPETRGGVDTLSITNPGQVC
jgi:superfamily I DNA and/or RNA helicase